MSEPNGHSALWQYDYFGQLQGHTDLGGAHYQYRYDARNQLVSTEVDGMEVEKRHYDGAGRLVQQGVHGLEQDHVDALNQDRFESEHIAEDIRLNRYDANGLLQYQRVLNLRGWPHRPARA